MFEKGVGEDVFKDRDKFMEIFNDFVFKCFYCGEEFYGRNFLVLEIEKVFELLNDFKGLIDWDNKRVCFRFNSFLVFDLMFENWDRKML